VRWPGILETLVALQDYRFAGRAIDFDPPNVHPDAIRELIWKCPNVGGLTSN